MSGEVEASKTPAPDEPKDRGSKAAPSSRASVLATVLFAVLVLATLVYEVAPFSRRALPQAAGWSALLLVGFWGFGGQIGRVAGADRRVGLGLTVTWGASVVCALGGLLAAFHAMTRGVAIVIVELGALVGIYEAFRRRDELAAMRRGYARLARAKAPLMVGLAFVALLVLIRFVGAIGDRHTNPYDDDIAYLAFVRRLSDTGTLIEPFSFRRLSALGGQLLFLSLLWPRVDASEMHIFDRGICFALIFLVFAGMRRGPRRVPLSWTLGVSAFLVVLPVKSINTASFYSGVVFFLALYRSIVESNPNAPPIRRWLPAALVAACTCTLRQNYLPAVFAITVALGYLASRPPGVRVRDGWKTTFRTSLPLFLWTGAAVIPWLFVSWQSNATFLFPAMKGTFNAQFGTQVSDATFLRQVKIQVWSIFDTGPLKVLPALAFAAIVSAKSPRRSLVLAFAAASLVGSMLVVNGFSVADPGNIARYTFGFWCALVLVITAETAHLSREKPAAAKIPIAILIAAFAVQIAFDRNEAYYIYVKASADGEAKSLGGTSGPWSASPENEQYRRLQASLPAGAKVGMFLDDPYYLDYARNDFQNIDMPGYASPKPGFPHFRGAAAVREYFLALKVRYLAFVRGDWSRYMYRRKYWVEKLVAEDELWRDFAPYAIDLIDTFTELASTYPVLFDERGKVVVDLEGPKR